MTIYALMIVLMVNTTGIADHISWHENVEVCRNRAPVEMYHFETTGRPVASATCIPVRVPGSGPERAPR